MPTVIPVVSQWPQRKPWLMTSPAQFRPGPPPTLTSEVWARDYNEIKALGGKSSTRRTAEQTEVARFWEATLPPIYHGVVRSVANVPGREVRNQARMHLRNGHAPYRDSERAIAHWIETPTCVGVRMEPDGRLSVVAPHGLGENWSLRVTRNPLGHYPAASFNDRVRNKHWLEHWPKLQVEWAREA